ncbi:MAG: CopG family transcriptional regulator [Acidobacteria bacterium]|nr:MAG: CopG family transcriptional regulator [Acidobacteriota bacterium]
MCYTAAVKTYIHARLSKEDRAILEDLKRSTGHSESELVRRGLRLVLAEVHPKKSALELAGRSVGKFKKGPRDLATNKKHLAGFDR